MQSSTERLLSKLRRNWSILSQSKCTGTVAIVDLTGSTRFKSLHPPPDIWVERLYTFLEIVHSVKNEIFKKKPFVKNLGDGVLIFSKIDQADPIKFIEFSESLAERIKSLNLHGSRYTSEDFSIKFTLAIDYGSDIYLLNNDDPQGIVIDRVFRISSYLMPNMIGVSHSFYKYLKAKGYGKKFVLAGKAILKGISETWQEIYALNTIVDFSTQLSPEQKKKEALIDIWEMGKKDKPIWVISGDIHGEEDIDVGTYSVQHGDSNALIEIIHILSKLYPDREIKIVTSEEYLEWNKGSFDNDIVSISGPYYNLVAREMINKMVLPLNFELDAAKLNEHEDPILTFLKSNGNQVEFKTERDGSKISSDIAVFIKSRNKFTQDRRFTYLVMGNQTQGTYGSALMFGISTPHLFDNCEYLKNRLGKIKKDISGFGIIAKVPVINKHIERIELKDDKHLKMFTLPLDYKVNTVQKGPK
jgi:hypothetical protein